MIVNKIDSIENGNMAGKPVAYYFHKIKKKLNFFRSYHL